MFKTEKAIRRWIHLTPGMHVAAIEGSTTYGVPDLNFAVDGVEGWIEIKLLKYRKRTDDFVLASPFRPGQLGWIRTRSLCGGNVIVALGLDRHIILIRGLDFIDKGYWPISAVWAEFLKHEFGVSTRKQFLIGVKELCSI